MAADVPSRMAVPPVDVGPAAIAFDLRDYTATQAANARLLDEHHCADVRGSDEIVVCAPDQFRFRLRRDPAIAADPALDPTLKLSDRLSLTPELDAASLPGGVQSNRVMMRLKFGF